MFKSHMIRQFLTCADLMRSSWLLNMSFAERPQQGLKDLQIFINLNEWFTSTLSMTCCAMSGLEGFKSPVFKNLL